jgi:type IV pilus assembly protein PilX
MIFTLNPIVQTKTLAVPKKQSGVVLVMALVMLAVLTLIGVSSMSSSTLEMKVSSNMQQHNVAFQAAQSRLAFAGADDESNPVDYLVAIDVTADPDTWPVQTCNAGDGCVNGGDWKATAEVKYLSCGKGFGNSLEAGKGYSFRIFEITATGETSTGSSRSVQASGIRFPVKGCGDEL